MYNNGGGLHASTLKVPFNNSGRLRKGSKFMINPRVEELAARLEKGRVKTLEIFNKLTPSQWQVSLYHRPNWRVRQLLAHFVSAEIHLLTLVKSVAGGGPGSPEDFEIDKFNAREKKRLEGIPPLELLSMLDQARKGTIAWVRSLSEADLDKVGRHPALGEVTVETMILAIYGHQLAHMRELIRLLGSVV
jgi:hypothetical protein